MDQPGGDSGGVDAAAGVLVDLDVGLPAAAVQVLGAVKQVQYVLVVQLQGQSIEGWVTRECIRTGFFEIDNTYNISIQAG